MAQRVTQDRQLMDLLVNLVGFLLKYRAWEVRPGGMTKYPGQLLKGKARPFAHRNQLELE